LKVGWREKARLAQSVERLTLNQVVGGSSPPVGDHILLFELPKITLVNFLFACSN
jgi:hypothetical protein